MLGGEHAGPWVCQKACVCARSGLCVGCVCTSVRGHDVLPTMEAQFTHPVPCSGPGTGDVSWCGCEGSMCLRHARLADTITPTLSLCHHPLPGSASQMQKPQSGPKHQSPQTPPDTDISYVTLKTHAAGAGRQKAVWAGRVWIDTRHYHICARSIFAPGQVGARFEPVRFPESPSQSPSLSLGLCSNSCPLSQ